MKNRLWARVSTSSLLNGVDFLGQRNLKLSRYFRVVWRLDQTGNVGRFFPTLTQYRHSACVEECEGEPLHYASSTIVRAPPSSKSAAPFFLFSGFGALERAAFPFFVTRCKEKPPADFFSKYPPRRNCHRRRSSVASARRRVMCR